MSLTMIRESVDCGQEVGREARNWQTPKFKLFQEVKVEVDWKGYEGLTRAWIVGIQYDDPLAEAEFDREGQECLYIRDVEEQADEGGWSYMISFQWGLDRQQFADERLLDALIVSECQIEAIAPASEWDEESRAA